MYSQVSKSIIPPVISLAVINETPFFKVFGVSCVPSVTELQTSVKEKFAFLNQMELHLQIPCHLYGIIVTMVPKDLFIMALSPHYYGALTGRRKLALQI